MRRPPQKTKPPPRFEVLPPTPERHAMLVDKQTDRVVSEHPWSGHSEFHGFTKLDIISLCSQAAKDSGLDVYLAERKAKKEARSWRRYQKRQEALRVKCVNKKNRRR